MADIPRGIRNNNPGNIEYNPLNNWLGMLPHDPAIEPRFCRFKDPKYSIRAIMCILKTYQHKYGLSTVHDLIARYAPSIENDTLSYIKHVENKLGIKSTDKINAENKEISIELAKAIIKHENGQQPYHDAIFISAVNLL